MSARRGDEKDCPGANDIAAKVVPTAQVGSGDAEPCGDGAQRIATAYAIGCRAPLPARRGLRRIYLALRA